MFFTARIERPPLYRGGSASKKNGLPAPSHHSEAARCASTKGGLVALLSPCFRGPARFFELQGFEVDETESGRMGDVVTAAGKELSLSSTEQGHKPFLFEMPICREGL